MGTDTMGSLCLIERVENPAVLSQHRSIGQGDATRVSPNSSSVEVGRARRKVMHEGAVRVMAEGAGGRTLPVTRGTEGRRRSVKGVRGVLPDREEVVRGECQQGRHAGQTLWQRACDEGHGEDED